MRKVICLAISMAGLVCFSLISHAAQTVGTTAAVNPQAHGTPPGDTTRTLVLGNDVVFKERIDTSGEGLVQVLLVDGTTLTIGPDSSLVIDQFVYDPNAGTGKLVITFAQGAMRFIGGKLSKKEAAVVRTTIGTLGIRGGFFDMTIECLDRARHRSGARPQSACPGQQKGIFSLHLGKLTFEGKDGRHEQLFQPNYTLEISAENKGRPLVRRTRSDDIQKMQKKLASKTHQDGGAKKQPSDSTITRSNLAQENSEGRPEQYAQTVITTPISQEPVVEMNEATTDTAGTGGGFSGREYQVRMLSPPEPVFDVIWLPPEEDPTNPGALGLVGGTNDPDADVVNIATQISATTLQVMDPILGTMIFPFTNIPGAYDDVSFVDFANQLQTGTMYIGANADFIFYAIFEDNNFDVPTYVLAGEATPASGLAGNDRLLTYELLPDPRQRIAFPFMLADLVPDASNASVSQLYLMAPDGVTIGDNTDHSVTGSNIMLMGALLINGQGAGQTSAVSVLVGGFFDDVTGVPEFGTGRRGGVRLSSELGSLNSGGGIHSVSDPNGDHIFGLSANNFLLSSDFSTGDAYGMSIARNSDFDTFADSQVFSTVHVANLIQEEQQTALTRGSKVYTGYAAGMLESRELNDVGIVAVPYRSTGPGSDDGVVLVFDAARDSIGGSLGIQDIYDSDPDLSALTFGFGRSGLPGSGHSGAYVDDDRYAARHNRDPAGTFVVTQGGMTIPTHEPLDNPNNTYFFGSELMAPQTGFFPVGTGPCVCKFLEWGYWGTQFRWKPTPTEVFSEFFHLGTWVAGNITNEVDLQTSGTATYTGHAVGNVARVDDIDPLVTHQYIAGGDFDMSWDFAARSGEATISNFDGFTPLTGDVKSTSLPGSPVAEPNRFYTPYGLIGGDLTGNLSGSLVSGPLNTAQGVIGSFDLSGAGYMATGIVAGEQLP
jgi:hypothetical protein